MRTLCHLYSYILVVLYFRLLKNRQLSNPSRPPFWCDSVLQLRCFPGIPGPSAMSALAPPPPRRYSRRQNYAKQCEDAINTLIHLQLCTSYTYMSMSCYFNQDEMAMKLFSRYFRKLSCGVFHQAEKLMELQIARGARLCFYGIEKPPKDNWEDSLIALDYALILHKIVYDGLFDLHQLASHLQDGHLCGYLENHLLPQQVQSIKELTDHVSSLRKMRGQ